MIRLNAGAPRPATGDARLTAANALVRRTLAQHGLIPGADTDPGPMAHFRSQMQKLDFANPLARLSGTTQPGVMAGFGASAEPTIPIGAVFETGTFSNGAGSREYRLYVPSKTDEIAGVVMMLHGCTQNPEDFAVGTGMNALAEDRGFVVVYPRQSRGDNAQSCWNWFSRNDQNREPGEPAILAGMAQEIAARFDVGADRIFVAGLSAGAAMAVILGETHGDTFAAVGAHSGLPYGAARDVPSAFAAMRGSGDQRLVLPAKGRARTIVFHGTGDTTVHPSNGQTIGSDLLTNMGGQTIQTETTGTCNGRSWTCETTTDTTGTPLLEHWTVEGLGHAWSGGQPAGTYTDAKGPDASGEMVRFFFNTESN
ncbi:PHB depolymerase family esterase [Loktanella sp. TSTF-M6]|uniref:PHB depolymerase family esterase n=1 Tax=Loktanella gaetbuli TaxID=2881335 RepID=A0ABS8BRU2_9RHOB|nr:PHB depolymerase family esterase [Loktanella gaetbuli]MCB5198459.1 PHB depolymerase family esterase [Loktanella gaetbuli]